MKPRPITSMQSLTTDQILQVTAWLEDGLTLEKVSDLIEQEFHAHVSATSLHRFYHRHQARVLTESRTELTEDARSWAQYAAQGEVDFSTAALEAIRQKVFELAISNTDPEQLKALFTILFASQHAEVRKQNAGTAAKRTEIAAKRLALQEQKFRLILQKDGLIPFDDPTVQKEKSPELVEFLNRCGQEGHPNSPDVLRRIYQEVFRGRKSPAPVPAPVQPAIPEPEKNAVVVPSEEEEEPLPGEEIAGPNYKGHPQPDAPTLHDRISAYVDVRRKEYERHLQRKEKARHQNSQSRIYYYSSYQCCPCGHRYLPCPHHGRHPHDFQTSPPGTEAFKSCMQQLFPSGEFDHLFQAASAP